jgi:hypothetical protein
VSRAPIQLEYAQYHPDPARREKRAAAAITACIVFLTIAALASTTAAVLEDARRYRSVTDVLYFAIYGGTFAILAVLWSVGRTRVLTVWNSIVFTAALLLTVIAWAH